MMLREPCCLEPLICRERRADVEMGLLAIGRGCQGAGIRRFWVFSELLSSKCLT